MKIVKTTISILSLILLSIACSNNDDNTDNKPIIETKIYAAGSSYSNVTNKNTAKFWINGKANSLTDGNGDAEAKSILVAENGDTHVVGDEQKSTSIYVAKYWKNSIAIDLPATIASESSFANDIAIANGIIYIAGSENINGKRQAILWKNFNKENLSSTNTNNYTNAITVKNDIVYVVGYEMIGNLKIAKIWIDGVAIDLAAIINNVGDSYAKDVIVIGTKIYVAGFGSIAGKFKAIYWIKDLALSNSSFTAKLLSNSTAPSFLSSITNIGNDIYFGGRENTNINYWKLDSNLEIKTTTLFSETDTNVTKIFGFESDIYSLTESDGNCKYWKNTLQITTIAIDNLDNINDIFVTNK